MFYTKEQLVELLGDSRYQNIGNLPSNFFPYKKGKHTFDKLYVRPFSINELKLVSKAAVLRDMKHMIRAIDLTITESASDLSIGDFYYVMMWQRIHSYPKAPIIVSWHCTEDFYKHKTEPNKFIFNDEFIAPEDISEWNVETCDTHNDEIIHMTDVEIICLEDDFEPLPDGFDFPRAKHIADIQEEFDNPELKMMLPAIQWIEGETVKDKILNLEQANDLDILDIGYSLNKRADHGIKETTHLKCRKCRSRQPYVVRIDPLSFFK